MYKRVISFVLVVVILCAILCSCRKQRLVDETIVQTEILIEETDSTEVMELIMPFETEAAEEKKNTNSESDADIPNGDENKIPSSMKEQLTIPPVKTPPATTPPATTPPATTPPTTVPSETTPSIIEPPQSDAPSEGDTDGEFPADPDQGEII